MTDKPDCDICGQPYFSHIPIYGAGRIAGRMCPVSAASYRPKSIAPAVKAEDYARGLLGEEASEIGVMLGKAARFGIDTPGPSAAPYFGMTARVALELECGDMLAAIEYAFRSGLIRRFQVQEQKQKKIAKLTSPDSKDNLGRRLAPEVAHAAIAEKDSEIRKATTALINKLDLIVAHPAFSNLFALAHARGQPYAGPQFGPELEEARSALAATWCGDDGRKEV